MHENAVHEEGKSNGGEVLCPAYGDTDTDAGKAVGPNGKCGVKVWSKSGETPGGCWGVQLTSGGPNKATETTPCSSQASAVHIQDWRWEGGLISARERGKSTPGCPDGSRGV
jgi:hypothetical protein